MTSASDSGRCPEGHGFFRSLVCACSGSCLVSDLVTEKEEFSGGSGLINNWCLGASSFPCTSAPFSYERGCVSASALLRSTLLEYLIGVPSGGFSGSGT